MDLRNIDTNTIIRTLCLALTIINAVLQSKGMNVLPIDDAQIATLVSDAALIGASVWNWYKNNNLTSAAQSAQKVLDAEKALATLKKLRDK